MSSRSISECPFTKDSVLGLCVDQYQVTRKIGQGGMGAVYEAVHVQLQRKAALKVLRPRFAQNPDAVHRFFNEACAVSHIHHAGLASVFAAGELPDGTHYFLMDYLAGETLGHRLRAEPSYELGRALRLAEQLASTLAIVHEHGIVHCDLKPDNIMIVADPHVVGGERAVLLDFGIAQPLLDPAQPADELAPERTREGHLLGTPLYMSPEQCRGASRIDGKADVYALGVLLFRLCTGRFPFIGDLLELLVNHVAADPPAPRLKNPALSPALDALITRMLSKAPGARPTMAEVASTLSRLEAFPEPARAVVDRAPRSLRAPRPARTAQRWAFITCLFLLAIETWYLSSGQRGIPGAETLVAASALASAHAQPD